MNEPVPQLPDDHFSTTRWTKVIEAAQRGDEEEGGKALEAFCWQYRSAIYHFIRRRGWSHEDAEDMVQAFFEQKIVDLWTARESFVHKARREKGGKFRSFLSFVVVCFVRDEWKKRHSIKAGGGVAFVPLTGPDGSPWPSEPAGNSDFDQDFDRSYAQTVLEVACRKNARSQQFLAILRGDKTQAAVAEELSMSTGSVKVAYHRFLQKLGEAIREEVRRTVGEDEAEVEEEIRYLMSRFGRAT